MTEKVNKLLLHKKKYSKCHFLLPYLYENTTNDLLILRN